MEGVTYESNCEEGIRWIKVVFTECVDTNVKLAGFIIGLISLVLWLFPLLPQFIQTYKTKKCEGLSVGLLCFLLLGDVLNCIGVNMTDQQLSQKIIGVFFVIQDLALCAQRIYYSKFYNKTAPNRTTTSGLVLLSCVVLTAIGCMCLTHELKAVQAEKYVNHTLEEASKGSSMYENHKDTIGFWLGIGAAICYIVSRVPQIQLNYEENIDKWNFSRFNKVITVGCALLLLMTETQEEKNSLDFGLPTLRTSIKPKSYMMLIGRIVLTVMFTTLNRVELSIEKLVEIIVDFFLMALILIGYKTKISAMCLAIWLFGLNMWFNAWWNLPSNDYYRHHVKYDFIQTLSFIGGLLLIITYGPGDVSVDHYKKTH